MTDHACTLCEKVSSSAEGIEQHMRSKHGEHKKTKASMFKAITTKRVRNYIIVALIVSFIVWGYSSLGNTPTLPPTTMQGHIEVWPDSQILHAPIRPEIFKHILEHDPTESRPGMVITYDCESFSCPHGLPEQLGYFTANNSHVFVAPYRNQQNMIVVTRLGWQKTFDVYDHETIAKFVS